MIIFRPDPHHRQRHSGNIVARVFLTADTAKGIRGLNCVQNIEQMQIDCGLTDWMGGEESGYAQGATEFIK